MTTFGENRTSVHYLYDKLSAFNCHYFRISITIENLSNLQYLIFVSVVPVSKQAAHRHRDHQECQNTDADLICIWE